MKLRQHQGIEHVNQGAVELDLAARELQHVPELISEILLDKALTLVIARRFELRAGRRVRTFVSALAAAGGAGEGLEGRRRDASELDAQYFRQKKAIFVKDLKVAGSTERSFVAMHGVAPDPRRQIERTHHP